MAYTKLQIVESSKKKEFRHNRMRSIFLLNFISEFTFNLFLNASQFYIYIWINSYPVLEANEYFSRLPIIQSKFRIFNCILILQMINGHPKWLSIGGKEWKSECENTKNTNQLKSTSQPTHGQWIENLLPLVS